MSSRRRDCAHKPVLIVHGSRDETLGVEYAANDGRGAAGLPAVDGVPRVRHVAHDDRREPLGRGRLADGPARPLNDRAAISPGP